MIITIANIFNEMFSNRTNHVLGTESPGIKNRGFENKEKKMRIENRNI